jgi:hypothetical protein
VFRWLFERFQQRIEAVIREHVNFVDQINLEARARWRVLNIIKQVSCIFDLGSRGSINFQNIDASAFGNLDATRALSTGLSGYASFAVEAFRDQPSDRGFAYPTRTREQVGMVQSLGL